MVLDPYWPIHDAIFTDCVGGDFSSRAPMRAVRVEARDEIAEAGLLLEHVAGRRLRRFALQRENACPRGARCPADALGV